MSGAKSNTGLSVVVGVLLCVGLGVVAVVVITLVGANSDLDDDLATVDQTQVVAESGNGATDEAAAAAACNATPDSVGLDTRRVGLYPNRLGAEPDDHEAVVGDCVRISGLTAYVNGVSRSTDGLGNSLLLVDVTVKNRDPAAQQTSSWEWKVQTPGGELVDQVVFTSGITSRFDGAELAARGGQAGGVVPFEVPPDDYFVVWEPSTFSSDRGVWKVSG